MSRRVYTWGIRPVDRDELPGLEFDPVVFGPFEAKRFRVGKLHVHRLDFHFDDLLLVGHDDISARNVGAMWRPVK